MKPFLTISSIRFEIVYGDKWFKNESMSVKWKIFSVSLIILRETASDLKHDKDCMYVSVWGGCSGILNVDLNFSMVIKLFKTKLCIFFLNNGSVCVDETFIFLVRIFFHGSFNFTANIYLNLFSLLFFINYYFFLELHCSYICESILQML
jgi:hypothetical protein